MPRVHIRLQGGASKTSKLLGLVLAAVALVCVVLLFLGLWILLAIAVAAMAIVVLVRALLRGGRAREPMVETHATLEGQGTTLHDADEVKREKGSFRDGPEAP
jgi:UDP-N-acetylmuramyl pentapeptide phosphotransferase/UDP-N-acetylglucosamine-1-phosphate transferase